MKRPRPVTALLVLLAAATTAGCTGRTVPATEPASTGDSTRVESPLAATAWVLTEIGGQPPLPHTPAHLRFAADGALTGSDGCNILRGAYTAGANRLRIAEKMAATMMACPPAVTQQAANFTAALPEIRIFAIDGSYLRLLDADDRLRLVFIAESSTLPGSAWTVTGYNNGTQAVVSVLADTEISAAFGHNARLTGSAGCNAYVAEFDAEANKLRIGPPRTTRKLCPQPEGAMEQERLFLDALQTVATFRLTGDRLELRTADGATAVTLQRAEEDAAGSSDSTP